MIGVGAHHIEGVATGVNQIRNAIQGPRVDIDVGDAEIATGERGRG